jgi:N-acetylmuramoyl-L-alanine amidase
VKIGIDPGHGGFDPGAVGKYGLKEKDVTLAISLELDRLLRQAGLEPVLTRQADEAPGLVTRSALINNMKCDLAISVHINSADRREADYISTFIQGGGGRAEQLAKKVQAELVQVTGWEDGGVRVKNLHMTRETVMPAILCECGFISNPEQERQLRDVTMQKKIAQAIAAGVLAYLGKPLKEGKKLKEIKVVVKGQEIPGIIIDNRTWVPLQQYEDAKKTEITWDGKTNLVTVR